MSLCSTYATCPRLPERSRLCPKPDMLGRAGYDRDAAISDIKAKIRKADSAVLGSALRS
jgi:hypothetical protein